MALISKVLIVLASPEYSNDNRGNYIIQTCKEFMEILQNKGINVDLIDLYRDYTDDEFNPIAGDNQKETKVLEYQVRIRKAEVIIFFHPVWQGFLPAILKGFLEKVFVSGFAFANQKNTAQPFLEGKKSLVFAFSERSGLDHRIIYGNMIQNFWQRSILKPSGITGKYNFYGNMRSLSDAKLQLQTNKILQFANKLNSKDSLLDLI